MTENLLDESVTIEQSETKKIQLRNGLGVVKKKRPAAQNQQRKKSRGILLCQASTVLLMAR